MATTRGKRKGYVDANLYVADVESIGLRNDGDETQPALTIKTRTGFLVIRCIGKPGTVPRFIDLRQADRKRRRGKVTTWNGLEMRNGLVKVMTSEEAEHQMDAAMAAQDAREDR